MPTLDSRAEATESAGTSVAAGGFRPEIQALRAVAVGLVVVYHLWPNRIPGGYIGVDIFFVISGFLITSHLLGEVHRTGSVSLSRFWARRIRRLLPASLVVLLFTLIIAFIWIPDSLLQQNLREIGASAVYVVNWVLGADAVDYLAAENLPSLVQHFWSLSVEEQFYIVWPLLLVAALAVVRAGSARSTPARAWPSNRVAITTVLAGVFVASYIYSIIQTNISQPLAYFSTVARAWEFAAGALLAAVIVLWPKLGSYMGLVHARLVGEVTTWIGIAVIAASALFMSDATAFPGWIAVLPVLGAVLVILGAGLTGPNSFTRRLFSFAPLQRIGDWSYAIYLWHWPLIAVYPFVFGNPFGTIGALSIGAISILLGFLTKLLVEDPVRSGRWWAKRRWPSFALAVLGAVTLVGATTAGSLSIDRDKAQAQVWAQEQLAGDAPCFGARAMASDNVCVGAFALGARTDLKFAATDLDADWCLTNPLEEWRSCEYGETVNPERTIALVGDSHAAALVPAFDEYFSAEGWRVVTYLRFGCPGLSTEPIDVVGTEPETQKSCADWSGRVLDELESRDDIDLVVFSNFSGRYADPDVPAAGRLGAETIALTWSRLIDAGKEVALVRDLPDTGRINVPACLSVSQIKFAPCSFSREAAVVEDQAVVATRLLAEVSLVDMSDFFCDDTTCYSVIGDVVVYADDNHLSDTYARTLSPFLGKRIADAFAG